MNFDTPRVMGILNATPDSFYSQSRVTTEELIIERVEQIMMEGGDIIDVGGQSTSPTSKLLSQDEEWERLDFVLKTIDKKFSGLIISIDTFYAEVARRAVEEYGVAIINDISGGSIDTKMFETIATLNVPYILMHMRGTPQTMQCLTDYENFQQDIFYYFSDKLAQLNQMGVCDVIIDPGFGFSKTLDQNYELMGLLKGFEIFNCPILVGVSRKSMIYKLLEETPQTSLNGTAVLNTYAQLNGASILRVHDVKEAVESIKIMKLTSRYAL